MYKELIRINKPKLKQGGDPQINTHCTTVCCEISVCDKQ